MEIAKRFPGKDFEVATPESQGVHSGAIENALRSIIASEKDIHSMLVMRHGYLIHEQYFAPYTARDMHSMYSVSKSFTSTLIGIAQDKGILNIGQKLSEFFPDKLPGDADENTLAITLRDLLMMASGHEEDTFNAMLNAKSDWPAVFYGLPIKRKPGTHFVYNTGATYMLAAVLYKITGKTTLQLAREWMFHTIGIQESSWDADPQGISMGGTGLRVTPRSLLRMGTLLLHEGMWEDTRVVSAEWVREATSAQIPNGDPEGQADNWNQGYGYQFWRCKFGTYRADGMGGQFIVPLPEKDAVVVFTSALGSDIGFPLDVIETHLLPGMEENALPENEAALAQLRLTASRAANPPPVTAPQEARNLPYGRHYRLTENPLGLDSIEFHPSRYGVAIRASMQGMAGEVSAGWGVPTRANYTVPSIRGKQTLPVLSAGWRGNSLTLRVGHLGEPLTMDVRITFEEDGFSAKGRSTLGEPFTFTGKAR